MHLHKQFLTQAFHLKSAVSTEHGVPADDVTIENVVITSGSKKGEGFICEIAAVKFVTSFNGQTLQKNYIAKYAPEGAKGVFIKEVIWHVF